MGLATGLILRAGLVDQATPALARSPDPARELGLAGPIGGQYRRRRDPPDRPCRSGHERYRERRGTHGNRQRSGAHIERTSG
jgi:hypothetical protein